MIAYTNNSYGHHSTYTVIDSIFAALYLASFSPWHHPESVEVAVQNQAYIFCQQVLLLELPPMITHVAGTLLCSLGSVCTYFVSAIQACLSKLIKEPYKLHLPSYSEL